MSGGLVLGETIDNFINSLLTKDDPVVLERTIIDILAEYGFNKFTYLGFNPPILLPGLFFKPTIPRIGFSATMKKTIFTLIQSY